MSGAVFRILLLVDDAILEHYEVRKANHKTLKSLNLRRYEMYDGPLERLGRMRLEDAIEQSAK
jgi:hypothetical protein